MDITPLQQISEDEWRLPASGKMRAQVIFYADRALLEGMDDKVRVQASNVAMLPGIVKASYVMPDGHWGYGFPIGGVAAFDADEGGVVSAGGVGFDISCGVRCLRTGLQAGDVEPVKKRLVDALFGHIPAGLGSTGGIHLDDAEMTQMLLGGARWAVDR
ncbi:MAG: RtcB family protein, partial [Myxococcales bacterium]|nr:RtcB family protein [Myxococcales bacterium]